MFPCRCAAAAALPPADVSASDASGRTDVSRFASDVGGPIRRQARSDALSFNRSGAFSAESLTRGADGAEIPALSRGVGLRRFQVVSPVCMGRRSSKIATRKNAQDARKSKLYGKFGKQIISAVKAAGPSPASNSMLAALLVAAKQGGVPKDVIDRNIKRASEKGQADFTEIVYEIYGLGGVGIVVDVLTDNNARAAATVRDVVRKGGAKMADPGSVLFNFKSARAYAEAFSRLAVRPGGSYSARRGAQGRRQDGRSGLCALQLQEVRSRDFRIGMWCDVRKGGAKMADPGSVLFNFKSTGGMWCGTGGAEVYFEALCSEVYFEALCSEVYFEALCSEVYFEALCSEVYFEALCSEVYFEALCSEVYFEALCSEVYFEALCSEVYFEALCSEVYFEALCSEVYFEALCSEVYFEALCSEVYFEALCSEVYFEALCSEVYFEALCSEVYFEALCSEVYFEALCSEVYFEALCSEVYFEALCSEVYFEALCSEVYFEALCSEVYFEALCSEVYFEALCSEVYFEALCSEVYFEALCSEVYFEALCSEVYFEALCSEVYFEALCSEVYFEALCSEVYFEALCSEVYFEALCSEVYFEALGSEVYFEALCSEVYFEALCSEVYFEALCSEVYFEALCSEVYFEALCSEVYFEALCSEVYFEALCSEVYFEALCSELYFEALCSEVYFEALGSEVYFEALCSEVYFEALCSEVYFEALCSEVYFEALCSEVYFEALCSEVYFEALRSEVYFEALCSEVYFEALCSEVYFEALCSEVYFEALCSEVYFEAPQNTPQMPDPGSVLFNLNRQGVLAVPAATADLDEVLLVAVDAHSPCSPMRLCRMSLLPLLSPLAGKACLPSQQPRQILTRQGVLAVPAATADPDEVLVVAGVLAVPAATADPDEVLVVAVDAGADVGGVVAVDAGADGAAVGAGAQSPSFHFSTSPLPHSYRQGVLAVPAATADPDEVLVVAVDAGADDVINPGEDFVCSVLLPPISSYLSQVLPSADSSRVLCIGASTAAGVWADGGCNPSCDPSLPYAPLLPAPHLSSMVSPLVRFFRVLTPAESFASVRAQLQEYGLTVDAEHSGLMFIPTAAMQPDEEAREQNEALMEKLLELDDVDAVYCNQ
ncbi:unnamed protein product [Closterium sp. Yama58-4]|nr:unnamed protein product [Closterium sp. Yama58-4]